ncbi:GNAT family N-acetyltransferase [Streptomyces albireticuli]|uniref:Acetyltransferase n=1 Tax=Streptomyces albireticuli TaxID=1940 RepID=A0A2A2CXN5_9ACTN|nr:GNAT family N-acetyltransferase [Streptomyces albireticuli]MCD9142755.1 GNAT family N-acetyltransferase [Streptomyces albireticuli]MCD9162926.1 GNAT family N-acetyltransferase [Streptomyces albireticuli]MCD9192486.1 GNAT family N-acetyltransferase [Streptomyces albireticuli]PAU44963.1 acetyltransferase [Streptomyces albireticuli]
MDIVFRPLEAADIAALAALREEVERTDRTGIHHDLADIREEFTDPKLDLAHDTLGAWQGTRLVAYALVYEPETVRGVLRFDTAGAVDPAYRRRGLGTRMVDWMRARARALHAERAAEVPGELHLDGISTNAGLAALAERAGFAPSRYWFTMSRDLRTAATSLPEAAAPAGLRLAPFAWSYDEAVRLAHNEAFLDHWDFAEADEADWRTWNTGSRSFRADVSAVLLDAGDHVAAYLLADEYDADTAATGVRSCAVAHLGTRRAYRGKGAARALLAHTLRAARDQGYDRAELVVDTANPTGALGIYESLGFVNKRTLVTYAGPLGE